MAYTNISILHECVTKVTLVFINVLTCSSTQLHVSNEPIYLLASASSKSTLSSDAGYNNNNNIFSSQTLWRIWVPSALHLWSSWESLDVGWVASLEKSERPAFFSSVSLLQYNVLIWCFCTMASLMTFRTSSNFSCFYPFCF